MSGHSSDAWLEGVYHAKTQNDLIALYDTWADTYDADMQGIGALVRTFSRPAPKAEPLSAGQAVEASVDVTAAERTYATTVGWYAGCASPRVQLLATHRVEAG